MLYVLMGISSWMVWTHGGFARQKLPLTLYGLQLLFNFAWQPIFFIFHNLDLALWDALGVPPFHTWEIGKGIITPCLSCGTNAPSLL
jgi:tryptophan-rich sensory protein